MSGVSAGTMLSDLESKSPVMENDGDLVNQILETMNMPRQQSANSPGPGMQQQNQVIMQQQYSLPPAPSGRVINSPNPNSTYPNAVDPASSNVHIIGSNTPTPADFAAMMNSPTNYHQQMPSIAPQYMYTPGKGNWYTSIFQQIRQPILVAIIVFAVSLPIINVLIGHYLPSLLRIGGDLTTTGLLMKSVIAGALYWLIQTVLVPLMASS